MLDRLRGAERLTDWQWRFQASELPACPLQHVWYSFDRHLDRLPRRRQTFIGDYYTTVGAAVHTVIQRWLGRLGVLYGDWRCRKCGNVQRQLGTPECCGRESDYRELAFDGPPAGRCDGLLRLGDDDSYTLLEIKSTSRKRLEAMAKHGVPLSYELQATVYMHEARQAGYAISNVIFLLVPRDAPTRMEVVPMRPKRPKAVTAAIVAEHEATQAALKSADFSKLSGTCTAPENAPDCPYRTVCFSPSARALFLDKAVEFYKSYEEHEFPYDAALPPRFPSV